MSLPHYPTGSIEPIYSVNGFLFGKYSNQIRTPASYQYVLEDVSASDAGRTEDVVMHKKRLGQTIALELAWNNLPIAEVSRILRAFQPEYVTVVYLDALAGDYRERVFYVGNRSAPLYNTRLNVWSNVSFKLIDRDGSYKGDFG